MDTKKILQTLELAETELKSCYRKLGITESNVLMDVVEAQKVVKNCNIADVVKSLPTDECVEQWWAEGKDQKEGFWQEAPYRTNGDVVEEIKTALKYFIETWQR